MKLNSHIGDHIKTARVVKSMTQKDLADKLGVTRVYVGLIERGQANISLNLLEKISIVLDVYVQITLTPSH